MRMPVVAWLLCATCLASPTLWAAPLDEGDAGRGPGVVHAADGAAQQAISQDPQESALRVFLDCDHCDSDYLRREVTFVNYVRDRQVAEVHVLVTTRSSGGGTEWTFAFIGLEQHEGLDVTLLFNSSDTDTDDEVRGGYAQIIRIGLLNYLANSPLAELIEIDHRAPTAEEEEQATLMAQPEDDPWNFWVLRAEMDADFEGQQRTTEKQFSGEFSANRTTEAWKIRTQIGGRYGEDVFERNDGSILVSDTRNYQGFGQVVKSLGPKWGASIRGAADASTFENQNLAVSFAPGIEYNIYPYDESSRRLFTFTYEIGFSDVRYEEETIFDVTEESLFDHTLLTQYTLNQPWGQSALSVLVSQFLNHADQYRVQLGSELEFRIIRGLSFDVEADFSLVRDQRFLPKEDISDEEVLLRRRALATDYDYEISIGFSYTFGSIFNNVVNPRFSGRRGGGFFH